MTTFQSALPSLRATNPWPIEVSTSTFNTVPSQSENSCAVTMVYIGPPPLESNGPFKFKVHPDEVLILQSHTETGIKVVFKGSLKPNGSRTRILIVFVSIYLCSLDAFTFKSSRVPDRHLVLDIYINEMLDQHVFVCCERGFVNDSHFPIKRRSCKLKQVIGGILCET